MSLIRSAIAFAFLLGPNSAFGEPLSVSGFEVMTERVYRPNTLTAQDLGPFLQSETYPLPIERLYNPCRRTSVGLLSYGDAPLACISGEAFRSFVFPDLILTLERDVDENNVLVLWSDTPLGLSLIESIPNAGKSKGEPLTLRARHSAERSNTKYRGRFVKELVFEVGSTVLTFANYNSYGEFVAGEGPGKFTSNFKIQETWMTEVCDNCFEPINGIPLLEEK